MIVSPLKVSLDFALEPLQVGLQGSGCPGPWTVTPSVYSMLLINVESTVKAGALYPAKPYHEDVDFAHLCAEKRLVVVKCNWLFFHKVTPHLHACIQHLYCNAGFGISS